MMGLADLADVLALEDGLFDDPIRPDQSAAFLADPMNLLAIAYSGLRAVGMASATILRHPDKAPSLFVNEVGTRDGWTRQGVASALMHTLISTARARGCEGVWVGTEHDNEPAKALYRSLGAVELPGVFFGWDDAI